MTEIHFPYVDPVTHDGNIEAPPGRVYVPPPDTDATGEPGNPGDGPEVDPEPEAAEPAPPKGSKAAKDARDSDR